MEPIWYQANLSEEIMKDDGIYSEIQNIVTDVVSGKLEITNLVENMSGVLTNKEPENRVKGMVFFTRVLKQLPKDYLTDMQLGFISKFYSDRLKDNHRVIPAVLEGYSIIIEMSNYDVQNCTEFFTILFREVSFQSQVREDRFKVYAIIQRLLETNLDYVKTLGPDFLYGVITSINGESDPKNLLFLLTFLPKFISNIPLGHLVEEMFEVVSCYYPIDYNSTHDNPNGVTRQDLASALAPCLCATPEFAQDCFVLLIEKLDSSLRLAKIDSLRLLIESCKTFLVESYIPFLKTLWSSIQREMSHKTDGELKMVAYEALSALVKKLSTSANTDQSFENFVKGIIISMQTSIAESTTLAHFVQATKILLTTANASKESCKIVTNAMIPATITYYGFNTSPKLQTACLDFLGDLTDLAKHWEIVGDVEALLSEIPQFCLTAISKPEKEYQIAGFKTLIRAKDVTKSDIVSPLIDVLISNIQHAQDVDLLAISIETVHTLARQFPALIMDLVVKGKCKLNNLTQDKAVLSQRLDLLCNLASIDDFTKVIIEEILKIITLTDKEDAHKAINALSTSISNSNIYSGEKVEQIESDHGLIESVLSWLILETSQLAPVDSLTHGYSLVSNVMASLTAAKQITLLTKHTNKVLELTRKQEVYFLILESLYKSLRQSIYEAEFGDIMVLTIKLCLESEEVIIRTKACVLVSHLINKVNSDEKFDCLYALLKEHLSLCNNEERLLHPNEIALCGWIAKSLIMRGNDLFLFWLRKIISAILNPDLCNHGAESIKTIMTDTTDCLNVKFHCRTSLFYKQRIFQTFMSLTENVQVPNESVKEAYLLSWAHIISQAPKTVLIKEIDKISPKVIDSLAFDNKVLVIVNLDVLCYLIEAKQAKVADSLQTILPRLVNLSKYVKSMDVRIKSLQCLYEIANVYPTILLLPHKQDVLFDLSSSLDDKKRLVRNMAARARTRWYLIGAPGEDAAK